MNNSSLVSMRNNKVSAHKCAPAEWPVNTILSYKRKHGKEKGKKE